MARACLVAMASALSLTMGCAAPSVSETSADEAGLSGRDDRDGSERDGGDGASGSGGNTIDGGGQGSEACDGDAVYYGSFPLDAFEGQEAIRTRTGRWLIAPLFENAPEVVQRTKATFRWSGAPNSKPAVETLMRIISSNGGVYAPGRQVAAAAGEEIAALFVEDRPAGADAVGPMGGSVGCDVCGVIEKDRLWAVLPTDMLKRRVIVRLSNGSARHLAIPGTGNAVTMSLPAPPRGLRYDTGRVLIF